MRVAPVTASARSVPALTYDIAEPGVVNTICTWPAIKSVIAGASPRYGTSAILRPAIMLNSAPATWPVEPMPPEPILILPGLALAYAKPICEHAEQRTATKAMWTCGGAQHMPEYRPGRHLANENLVID